MRYPAVAGAFYDSSAEGLKTQVRGCFESKLGPGELPSKGNEGKSRKIRGIVVPHAGLMYSGPVAAHAYLELWKDGLPEVFVIIGPNHYGTSDLAALSSGDYITPLGTAHLDSSLSRRLEGGLFDFDDEAQAGEHSIEVQLPFLQFMRSEIRFVPVCMGAQDYETARQVGLKIASAIKDVDAVVIASSDFSHYVTPEAAREKDMVAIDRILHNDPGGLYEAVVGRDISMCGYGPVMAMLCAVGSGQASMLAYGHSGQVERMREVVAYCSIKVE